MTYEVLTDIVEHSITVLANMSRDTWDSATTDSPTWMRASTVIDDMTEVGTVPVRQHIDASTHWLMATPGPNAGATFCSKDGETQVRGALDNIKRGADRVCPPTCPTMVKLWNSKEAHWLHMSMLGTRLAEYGACRKQDGNIVGGVRGGEGDLHLGDAGMMFIGRNNPKLGYTSVYHVIEEYRGFSQPGIDRYIQGRAGPKQWLGLLDTRDKALAAQCPKHFPLIVKEPVFGSSLMN